MNVRDAIVKAGIVGALTIPVIVGSSAAPRAKNIERAGDPATPIKHLVVIFDENISFDHYFGTYPNATNPAGEPAFHAAPDTPTINGLGAALLTHNPNMLNAQNGSGATNPFRLDRSQALTADQDHDYGPEQMAFDHGLMDLFPFSVGTAGPPPAGSAPFSTKGLVMGYYDGNTVTALWNYAQHFAMSDNSYGTTFGPSTVGALNLVSGQTGGVLNHENGTGEEVDDGAGGLTVIGDPDPIGDNCSAAVGSTTALVSMSGENIGDLLNDANVTWGWFQGGFDLTAKNSNGTTGCNRSTASSVVATAQKDYVPHHEPFQYYASTANPHHLRPSSVSAIGQTDQANHQYDINDFYAAVNAGHFPAISFLKPIKVQNGHAGNSDPLDEQAFIVHVINFLETRPEWQDTAVVIAYDDSDGWYDHQMSPIVNQSTTPEDHLSGENQCGTAAKVLDGANGSPVQGRCGYGPRLPLLVISPWAKQNFVDHTVTDQTSIIHFIEDNWLDGHRIDGSFDGLANSIANMFIFSDDRKAPEFGFGDLPHPQLAPALLLDESTGEPKPSGIGFGFGFGRR